MTDFIGYPRPDGAVGVRNHLLLLGLDPEGMSVCYKVARLVRGTLPVFTNPKSGNILQDVVRHPNVAGGVVVGKDIGEPAMSSLISQLERTGRPHDVIDIGQLGPVESISKATRNAIEIAKDMSTQRRELARLSKLLPVFHHGPDDLATKLLSSSIQFIVEENGRCLWVEKGTQSREEMKIEIGRNLIGDVEAGQAPGPAPGLYRYVGPENDAAILRTILACGAQIMVFPRGPRCAVAEALIPGVSFVAGEDPGLDQTWDLDLRGMKDREFTKENAGLLLFSEIVATASGKLTKGELLRDVLII